MKTKVEHDIIAKWKQNKRRVQIYNKKNWFEILPNTGLLLFESLWNSLSRRRKKHDWSGGNQKDSLRKSIWNCRLWGNEGFGLVLFCCRRIKRRSYGCCIRIRRKVRLLEIPRRGGCEGDEQYEGWTKKKRNFSEWFFPFLFESPPSTASKREGE